MTAQPPHPDLAAALEAEEPFLRRLARSLIADEHAAADAVQDTLLSAWKAGSNTVTSLPDDGAHGGPQELEASRLRAWLAAVLRRKSVSRLRSAAHYHERQAPDRQGAPYDEGAGNATADLAADAVSAPERVALRIESQALLHASIQALPEAYRTAIVLRFQDSMSAAEIADELGIPVATVRSQIQRGLEKLRSELDRQLGRSGESNARASWLAALTPLAFPDKKSLAAPPSTGMAGAIAFTCALVMKKVVLVSLAVIAAAGLIVVNRVTSDGPETSPGISASAPAAEVPPLVAVRPELGNRNRTDGDSQVLPSGPAEQSAQATLRDALDSATIEGRALLMDGTVLAGIKVSARRDMTLGVAPIALAHTDKQGSFKLVLPPEESAEPVTVLVSSEFDIPEGAAKEGVLPGTTNLEFRIDAVVVRVFPNDVSQLNAAGRSSKENALLRVTSTDPDSVTGGFLPFGYHTSTEKTSFRLLRPGFEYLFTVIGGEFGAEEWTAVVPADLRSGVHELLLTRRNQALASYTAHLTGEALVEGQSLWVALTQETDASGQEVDGRTHGSSRFNGTDTTVNRDSCLPGRSFVSTNITSRRDPSFLYVTNQYQSVELAAGERTEFTINLARGGRFSVHVTRADGETPDAPLQGLISYAYVSGGPPGSIGAPNAAGQLKSVGKKGRWAMAPFVELGETFICQDAIHPGTIEVELSYGDHESCRATLEIVAGELTEWKAEL